MIEASFNSGAGRVEINIQSNHSSVAQISNLGSLNYSFDQTPDTLSIDRVQALYTFMNVDLLQYDDRGFDLWSVLTEETSDAQLNVDMSVDIPGGSFQFLFRLRKSDISVNEKSGIVTLRLTPLFDNTISVQDVLDDISPKSNFRTTRGGLGDRALTPAIIQYPCVSVKSFIEESLSKVFGNNFDNLFVSSKTGLGSEYTENVFDDFQEGKKGFAIVEATVATGLDPMQFDDDNAIQGQGSIVVTDITDFEFERGQTIKYEMVAVGAGLQAVQRGDRLFITNGSAIGVQVESVRFEAGQWKAFIDASEPTMIVGVAQSTTVPNWSYVRGSDPAQFPAIDILKELGGIEGSIFGTGFSKNFYIHRLAIDEIGDNTVTLNYNELVEFKPFNFDLSIGKSFVGQLANWREFAPDFFGQWARDGQNSGVPNLSSGRTNTNGNRNATKGIEIELAPAYPLLNKGLFSSGLMDGREMRGVDNSLETALTGNGLRSYFQSLNATRESIAVEFEVLNAVRILPYQLFQFDSRAPERYRDKQFRITQVSYDFVNNTQKVRGYQISSITTPVVDDPRPVVPPPRIVPDFDADPIGRLVVGVDDETVTTLRINLYQRVRSTKSLLVLNESEREAGFFTDRDAGKYEVVVDKVNGEKETFLTGIKDVPIQSSRINAPEGSYVYISAPFDWEEDNDTDDKINELDEEFDNRIEELNEELDILQVELEELDIALEELNNVTLPELNAELDQLEIDLNTLTTVTLPALQSDLNDAESAINTLNTVTLPALQSDLNDAEGAINTLNTVTLPALQSDLSDAESAINTLNTVTIPALQSDLNTLETVTLPNLQSELDDILPITEVKIANDAISAPKLQANSVVAGKIATNAVTANEIAAGSIIASKIATNAVTANAIEANAITADKIQAGAVIAGKIGADAVTANTIATDAVTANKIEAGAVIAGKIGANAVTANTIATNAVTANKIQAGAVVAGKIGADAVTANEIAAGSIIAEKIAAGAIIAGKIGANAVVANNISANAVTANKIQAGAVITEKLSANAVTANKIDVDDLAANSAFIDALMARTLTITSDGKITNTGGTFEISVDGFKTFATTLESGSRAYRIMRAGTTESLRISSVNVGTAGFSTVLARNGYSLVLGSDDSNVQIGSLNTTSIRVLRSKLPTSNPNVNNQLYTQTASQLGGSGLTRVICISEG